MHRREAVDTLISDLGRLTGLPALSLDSAGACELHIDGQWRIALCFDRARARLILQCPVTAPEVGASLDRASLLQMLKANFVGIGSHGSALGIGPDGAATLRYDVAVAQTDADQLLGAIEHLLVEAAAWTAAMKGGGPPASADPEAPARRVRSLIRDKA